MRRGGASAARADTAVKERGKMVHKFKSAALKYEFSHLRGLPPPLNLASLPLELVGWMGATVAQAFAAEGEMPTISDEWMSVVKTMPTISVEWMSVVKTLG
eukprot:4405038-Prymnesium_polylepis.1